VALGELNRQDFGITTNIPMDSGGGHRRPHPGLHRDRSHPHLVPTGRHRVPAVAAVEIMSVERTS